MKPTDESKVRALVQKMLAEEAKNIKESELLAKKNTKWKDSKSKFMSNIKTLISKVDDDNYNDVEDLIGKCITDLQNWKATIRKDLSDNQNL